MVGAILHLTGFPITPTDIQKARGLSASLAVFSASQKKMPPRQRPPTRVPVRHPGTNKRHTAPFTYKINGSPGVDGKTPTRENLLAIIRPLIEELSHPTEDFVREVVRMMHSLPEADKLEVSKGIRNAQSFIFAGTKYQTSEMMHGAGSGGSTSTSVIGEVVSGTGTSWTLVHSADSGTLRLYANGQRLAVTTDYTISGASITTLQSWSSGTLLADYSYT